MSLYIGVDVVKDTHYVVMTNQHDGNLDLIKLILRLSLT